MKKNVIALCIIACIVASLTGCGSSGQSATSKLSRVDSSKVEGTWIVDSVTEDDVTHTQEELEALDETEHVGEYIVIKKDGKYLHFQDGREEYDEWELDEANLTLGYDEYIFSNGKITVKEWGEKVVFKKISDSQKYKSPYKYENKKSDYAGSWELTGGIIKDSEYSLKELETMDDSDYFKKIYIVLKNGGTAIVVSEDEIDDTYWRLSSEGVIIGDHAYTNNKDFTKLTSVKGDPEYNKNQFILKKFSDSQDISKLPVDVKAIRDKQAAEEEAEWKKLMDDVDLDLDE